MDINHNYIRNDVLFIVIFTLFLLLKYGPEFISILYVPSNDLLVSKNPLFNTDTLGFNDDVGIIELFDGSAFQVVPL